MLTVLSGQEVGTSEQLSHEWKVQTVTQTHRDAVISSSFHFTRLEIRLTLTRNKHIHVLTVGVPMIGGCGWAGGQPTVGCRASISISSDPKWSRNDRKDKIIKTSNVGSFGVRNAFLISKLPYRVGQRSRKTKCLC